MRVRRLFLAMVMASVVGGSGLLALNPPVAAAAAPGTCQLTAQPKYVPYTFPPPSYIYVPSGSTGYARYALPAPSGSTVVVSRGSVLKSQTYFLPILQGYGASMHGMVMMSQINMWNSSTYTWTGYCTA